MRFSPTVLGKLLEVVDRRFFQALVDRYHGDAYDKRFKSWDHLVALLVAQFSASSSLRGLEACFNANANHHYHLGTREIARSTLSDANARRPTAIFGELFTALAGDLDRAPRRDGNAMVRRIDSTPNPLGKLCDWAKSNGRFRGMKVHVVYDPDADTPRLLDITDANINDAQIGRTVRIEVGATYVYDKGYCHYAWWRRIDAAGSVFVTRPKINMGLDAVCQRVLPQTAGDGFTVVEDAEVRFASKGDSKLPMRLRRIKVRRDNGDFLTRLTNDMKRSAVAIGALYKRRWQIELLFRWIKQHLRIRRFMARAPNAIRLQILAAMIAYALLRIVRRANGVKMDIGRFTDLVAQCLFERRALATINQPAPVHPSQKKDRLSPNQLSLNYA